MTLKIVQRCNLICRLRRILLTIATPAIAIAGPLSFASATTEGLSAKVVAYDVTYNLHEKGSYVATTHEVIMPLNSYGVQKYGQIQVSFPSKIANLQLLHAYTMNPSGKRFPVVKNKIFTRPMGSVRNNPEFSDTMVTTVIFPHVAVGDKLVSNWKMVVHTPYFPDQVSISKTIPYFVQADDVRIIVHAPESMKLYWTGTDGFQTTHTERSNIQTITAILNQSKYLPYQSDAVSFYQVSPTFVLSTFRDWPAIGTAYWKYAESAEAVTQKIKNLADKIANNLTGEAAVKAIYDWTVHNIRWVGIETGLSGYKPYTADRTLTQGYGDCKAGAALLVALLHAKGIAAQPALLGEGTNFSWNSVANLQQLNHVIVYVPRYHLYLDVTSGYASDDTIPLPDADHPAILVGAQPEVVRTPGGGPNAGFTKLTERIAYKPNGAVVTHEKLRLQGYTAWMWRGIIARLPVNAYDVLLRSALTQAGQIMQHGSLQVLSKTDALARRFRLAAHWVTSSGDTLATGTRLHLITGFNPADLRTLTTRLNGSTIHYPAYVPYASSKWVQIATIPKGYAWKITNTEHSIHNSAGSYKEFIKMLDTRRLEVKTVIRLTHLVYSPSEYPSLYRLVSVAYAITQRGLVIRRIG